MSQCTRCKKEGPIHDVKVREVVLKLCFGCRVRLGHLVELWMFERKGRWVG